MAVESQECGTCGAVVAIDGEPLGSVIDGWFVECRCGTTYSLPLDGSAR